MNHLVPRMLLLLVVAALLFACGGSSSSLSTPSDDDNDASPDDDDDDNDDNDNDDASPDDDISPDDDASPLPDDYVAPWPQSNVEPRDYNENVAAGPLRAKGNDYDAWHIQWHEPYHGGSLDTNFTDATHTTVAGYGDWGDSCIWTGTYLGSQAMRYYVTNDAAAKASAIAMVHTLDGFLHVTGQTGFIARYWGSQNSLIYQSAAWCQSQDRCHAVNSGQYAGDFWWGDTSRDQYTGWFFGMAMAYDLVDDAPTRAMIAADVAEVVDALIAANWVIIDNAEQPPDGGAPVLVPQEMDWLLIAYHLTGDARYKTALQQWLPANKRDIIVLSNISLMNRYAQYYGNNLGHTNWYNLLRLGKVYLSPAEYAFLQQTYNTQTESFTRLSHNPWFTGIYMSQGPYAPQPPIDPYQTQLVDDLTDFSPAPSVNYALAARTNFTMDPLSELLYTLEQEFSWLSGLIGTISEQALEAFPIPQQCSDDFLFQSNPFQFEACGVDDPAAVNPGVDYLVAYWLASYHKFATKNM